MKHRKRSNQNHPIHSNYWTGKAKHQTILSITLSMLLAGCGNDSASKNDVLRKWNIEKTETSSNISETTATGLRPLIDESNESSLAIPKAETVAIESKDKIIKEGILIPENQLVFGRDENNSLILDKGLFSEQKTNPLSETNGTTENFASVSSKQNNIHIGEVIKRIQSPHEKALVLKEPTQGSLNPLAKMVFEGKEGTRLSIPKNAFEFENGAICKTSVNLSMWEFYELDDILLAGLTTESDQGLLQTGGMVYTETESEGRRVRLRKGKLATLSFSPSFETKDYDLYDGQVKEREIVWSKTNATVESSGSAGVARVSMIRNGSRNSSSTRLDIPIGFLEYLERKDSMKSAVDQDVMGKPQTLRGLGEVVFPNGVRLFFNGELRILKYQGATPSDYHRYANGKEEFTPSSLEAFFTGAFICGKLPKLHPDSSLKIFLMDEEVSEGSSLKFITHSPKKESGSFIVNSQFLHEKGFSNNRNSYRWKSVLGKSISSRFYGIDNVSYDSTRPNVRRWIRLGNRIQLYPLSQLTPESQYQAKILHSFGGFGVKQVQCYEGAIGFHSEHSVGSFQKSLKINSHEPVDLLFWKSFLKHSDLQTVFAANNLKRLIRESTFRFDNSNIRNWNFMNERTSTFRELVVDRMAPVFRKRFNMEEDKKFAELLAAYEFIVSIQKGESEFLSEEEKMNIKKMRKRSKFRKQFLTPSLGWHNLDRLHHQGRTPAPLTLSCDFTLPEPSVEDPNALSIDPSFYAVWPKEGVSTKARLGENTIPSGNFVAFGFAVDENKEIFADIKPARTGQDIRLDLKKVSRADFRKQVARFR